MSTQIQLNGVFVLSCHCDMFPVISVTSFVEVFCDDSERGVVTHKCYFYVMNQRSKVDTFGFE